MNLDTDFNFAGPTLKGSAVFGYIVAYFKMTHTSKVNNAVFRYEGWLGGCDFGYDTSKSAFNKNNFALGYNGSDFQLLTTV